MRGASNGPCASCSPPPCSSASPSRLAPMRRHVRADAVRQRFADSHLTVAAFKVVAASARRSTRAAAGSTRARAGVRSRLPRRWGSGAAEIDIVPKLFAVDRGRHRAPPSGSRRPRTPTGASGGACSATSILGRRPGNLASRLRSRRGGPRIPPRRRRPRSRRERPEADLAAAPPARTGGSNAGFVPYRWLRRAVLRDGARRRSVRGGSPVREPKGLKRYATAPRLSKLIDGAIADRASRRRLEVTNGPRGCCPQDRHRLRRPAVRRGARLHRRTAAPGLRGGLVAAPSARRDRPSPMGRYRGGGWSGGRRGFRPALDPPGLCSRSPRQGRGRRGPERRAGRRAGRTVALVWAGRSRGGDRGSPSALARGSAEPGPTRRRARRPGCGRAARASSARARRAS